MNTCSTGLLDFGVFIPRRRILVEEIRKVWNNSFRELLSDQLLLSERAVLCGDEDVLTMGYEAARQVLNRFRGMALDIAGLRLGTCTGPYVAKPSATTLAAMLGLGQYVAADDIQFSTQSGAVALLDCLAFSALSSAPYLAIGADAMAVHAAPGTILEYSASAGAVALLVGPASTDRPVIAEFSPATRYISDLADMFRLDGQRYLKSGGVAAVESGLGVIHHTEKAVKRHFEKVNSSSRDYRFAVFQQPVGIVPIALGQRLGFTMDQIIPGLVAYEVGDVGSASALMSLALVLERSTPGDRILFTAYGFGAGAIAMDVTVTEAITKRDARGQTVEHQLATKTLVDYATAMKFEGKFAMTEHPLSAWT